MAETSTEEKPVETPPVKPAKKTGTSADAVAETVDISRQLKELQDSFNATNKTNEAKLAALPELQLKIDNIFKTHNQPAKPKSFWDDMFGNFFDGFFD
jgi:hypothetical protein